MNFYHFRPSCKVIKRSRTNKGPLLSNYQEDTISEIFKYEEMFVQKGKLDLKWFGIPYNYSRKVFVGGLPLDITESDMIEAFSKFGSLAVDWPYKEDTHTIVPPKGFVFLLFKENIAVDYLLQSCLSKNGEYFMSISSQRNENKTIQIRPWRLIGIDHVFVPLSELNLRLTVFVGGVPRTLDAEHMGRVMTQLFGKVAYVGIDTDPEYLYPKGSARVIFVSKDSVVSAIRKRFLMPAETNSRKMIEIKPYILDNESCDTCKSKNVDGKCTILFCPEAECLLYLCEFCWVDIHSKSDFLSNHKPMVKQGLDDYLNSLKKRGLHVHQ